MKVYRVEFTRNEGKGFYCYEGFSNLSRKGKNLREKVSDAHSDFDYRTPIESAGVRMQSNYICGCESLEALEVWFEGFFEKIKALPKDFSVVSYETSKVFHADDDLQLAFVPKPETREVLFGGS